MEEMIDILQSMSELAVLPESYRQEIRDELPQDAFDCKTYSLLVTSVLLNKLEQTPMKLPMLLNYLLERYAAKQYREMHLILIMCYMGVGLDPPPCFLEFSQYDDLLELLMNEIVLDFEDYISESIEQEGGKYA